MLEREKPWRPWTGAGIAFSIQPPVFLNFYSPARAALVDAFLAFINGRIASSRFDDLLAEAMEIHLKYGFDDPGFWEAYNNFWGLYCDFKDRPFPADLPREYRETIFRTYCFAKSYEPSKPLPNRIVRFLSKEKMAEYEDRIRYHPFLDPESSEAARRFGRELEDWLETGKLPTEPIRIVATTVDDSEFLDLESEQAALIAEIEAAFEGVSREGGISWRGAEIADGYGDESWGRFHDLDTKWEDLVDDPKWNSETGIGGWSFLDAIGFRYFLPAGMIRSIRDCEDAGFLFHLELPRLILRNHMLEKWAALDERQREIVAKFLLFMIQAAKTTDPSGWSAEHFRKAHHSHWRQYWPADESPYKRGFRFPPQT